MDPTTADDDEISAAVENFHAWLSQANYHISRYNEYTVWVHNLYNLTRSLNVNTKLTSRLRKQVAQDPVTAQHPKYTDSYFQHSVYEELSRMHTKHAYLQASPKQREQLHRRKYVYFLSNDTHSRAADLSGLLTVPESCTFRNKRGQVVNGTNIRSAAVSCRVRFLSTKTAKGKLSKAVTYYDFRPSVITRHAGKSTMVAHAEYDELAAPRRTQMWGFKCTNPDCPPDCEHSCSGNRSECHNILCEHNRMFIATTICSRETGSKAQIAAAKLGCPCTGKCGKYHPVSVDTLRHDREAPLEAAGIPQQYRSHALRGNSEVLTIRASQNSTAIPADEAMRRARHSRATQEKYYEREPHPNWVHAYNRLKEDIRRSLTVEEAQRLGSSR